MGQGQGRAAGPDDQPTVGRTHVRRDPLGYSRGATEVEHQVRRLRLGRWLYTLRCELPALGGELLPWEGIEAEVRRLAGRVEGKDKRIDPDDAVRLLKVCREATSKRENEPQDRRKILGDFITLGQSASFLARGGGRDS